MKQVRKKLKVYKRKNHNKICGAICMSGKELKPYIGKKAQVTVTLK